MQTLIYTPGRPPRALKHRLVSSTMTGPLTIPAAILHFSLDTSSGSPCSSGKSIFWAITSNGRLFPKIEITSSNLEQ